VGSGYFFQELALVECDFAGRFERLADLQQDQLTSIPCVEKSKITGLRER